MSAARHEPGAAAQALNASRRCFRLITALEARACLAGFGNEELLPDHGIVRARVRWALDHVTADAALARNRFQRYLESGFDTIFPVMRGP